MSRTARVAEEIFSRFPRFRRGLVVARNLANAPQNETLEQLLAESVRRAGEAPVDMQNDPRMTAWNETYKALGIKPNKFPPAHRSLIKRVQKPGATLPFINSVVAIMNIASIEGVLPVGGDDAAQTSGTMALRFALGTETFAPLGKPEETESPEEGEVIYVDEGTDTVMCRRWNWRNGHETRITESTERLVMNIDGLGEDSATRAAEMRDRVAELLAEHCGATVETALLTPDSPELTLPF
ncbi:MAG: B3/B4 domain-containing protein [Spirochaetota bacterium]